MPSFDLPWFAWSFLLIPIIAIGYGLIAEFFSWMFFRNKDNEDA